MPGFAGSSIAVQLAKKIGWATYTHRNGENWEGTNHAGVINATVTVSTTGSYTGTFGVNAGAQASFSGTTSETITGQRQLSISWSTKIIQPSGDIYVQFTVSVNNESRQGSDMIFKKEWLEIWERPEEQGGGTVYERAQETDEAREQYYQNYWASLDFDQRSFDVSMGELITVSWWES